MTTLSTTTAPVATLTEKELWAQFLSTTIQTSIKVGSATLKGEIDPNCSLITTGAYGWIGDFTEYVADQLSKTDSPAEELDTLIEDLKGYLLDLDFLRGKFAEVKHTAIIMPEEPDEETCSPEEHRAWQRAANEAEANPRYRAIAEDEREAA
ncbi:hypothetical protein [Rhizobium sp. TRM95796]|uniref:hypothetical protein n=1 Tax=Rhizobium sp. TRM95796 TaxID=2979862 RepID=UPI0021E71BA0|nr:hypothetical protein [Rhizobium sp. TRM95796]MCV3766467.1 hypothetical protein [Rhizobium sp. TRM95796]